MEQIIIAVVTSSAFTGVIIKIIDIIISRYSRKHGRLLEIEKDLKEIKEKVNKVKEMDNEIGELKQDILVILHDRIYQLFDRFIREDNISVQDRANIDYLYNRYENRGGNGKASLMYEKIKNIPIKQDARGSDVL